MNLIKRKINNLQDTASTSIAYNFMGGRKAYHEKRQADADVNTIEKFRGYGRKVTGEGGYDNPSWVAKQKYDDVIKRRVLKPQAETKLMIAKENKKAAKTALKEARKSKRALNY